MQDSTNRHRPPPLQTPWYPPAVSSHQPFHPHHSQSNSQSSIPPYPPSVPQTSPYPASPKTNGVRSRYEATTPVSSTSGTSDNRAVGTGDVPEAVRGGRDDAGAGSYGPGARPSEPWATPSLGNDRASAASSPQETRYNQPYTARDLGLQQLPPPLEPYRHNYGNGDDPARPYPPMAQSAGPSSSMGGTNAFLSPSHTPTSSTAPTFPVDNYMGGHYASGSFGLDGGLLGASRSSRELLSPDPDEAEPRHLTNFALFGKDGSHDMDLGEDDGDNRTRNAKAQKRHREKRKAFVKHLGTSNAVLQNEIRRLNAMLLDRGGPSGGSRCSGGPSCPSTAALVTENRDLLDQISATRAQNDELRNLLGRDEGLTGSLSMNGQPSSGAPYPAPSPSNKTYAPSYLSGRGASDASQAVPRQFPSNYLPPPSSLIAPDPAYPPPLSQHYSGTRGGGAPPI